MKTDNKTYIVNGMLLIAIVLGMIGIGVSGYFFGAQSGLLGFLIGITSCATYGVSYFFLSNLMGEEKALMGVVFSLLLWWIVFMVGMAQGHLRTTM